DVRRHEGAVIEVAPRTLNLGDARRDAAVDLADDDRAAPAVVNDARLEIVRAEVDECADRSLRAYNIRDRELVEAILRRDDTPVHAQMWVKRARGDLGVMRLRGEYDRVPLAGELVGRERGHGLREGRNGSGDRDTRSIDRADVLGDGVDHRDVVP